MAGGLLLVCVSAQAALRMQAATLSLPGVQMAGVQIVATLSTDGQPMLSLKAAKVSAPALGWHDVALTLVGEPRRAGTDAWKFAGHVTTRRAPGGALGDADVTVVYDGSDGTLEVNVTQGRARLEALLPTDQATHIQMTLTALPLVWLRGVLAAAWPEGKIDGGTVAGNVALDLAPGDTRLSGRVAVAGAALDSRKGNIASRKLGADGIFRLDLGAASTSVLFDGSLRGGELLLGPLYARLPREVVGLHVAASLDAAGITVSSLDFDDPEALRLTGSLGFDRRGNIDDMRFSRFAATFPAAYTRYGTALGERLTGLKSLTTSGSISGSFDLGDKGLQELDFTAHDLGVKSHGGSLAVDGLDGAVDWHAGASRPATHLKWNALSMYKLTFGPASMELRDNAGTLALQRPVNVGTFGGTFQLSRFAWQPDASKSQRLSAAFSLSNVDVNQLCKALGWPLFGGKLGGAVPDLSYRGDRLVLAGGLSLNVFGGSVSVTDLSMQHPFGKQPQLVADVELRQLDLAPLTGVFGVGSITGRLDGSITGLRLVDWKPVAFNAELTANGGGKISQDAIKDLTEVGGGGIAGGIQGIALRIFKTFGYSRLGLSCKLANGVCTMGGIVPDPDSGPGYTIVEGSGLPRITVIGHQRKVDWATLVSRLKSVAEGNGPVVK